MKTTAYRHKEEWGIGRVLARSWQATFLGPESDARRHINLVCALISVPACAMRTILFGIVSLIREAAFGRRPLLPKPSGLLDEWVWGAPNTT
jgi:hypothetical protein